MLIDFRATMGLLNFAVACSTDILDLVEIWHTLCFINLFQYHCNGPPALPCLAFARVKPVLVCL